jgi:hypothetical protein
LQYILIHQFRETVITVSALCKCPNNFNQLISLKFSTTLIKSMIIIIRVLKFSWNGQKSADIKTSELFTTLYSQSRYSCTVFYNGLPSLSDDSWPLYRGCLYGAGLTGIWL